MVASWQVLKKRRDGRKIIKLTLFYSVFSLCAFWRACFCSLSLACGAVAVNSYRGQPAASGALGSGRPASGQQSVAGGGGLQRLTQERVAQRRASKASKD